jgi:CheY-like chemotaxis protein
MFSFLDQDLQMPVMDGVEATRLISRRNGPHPIPKIVFLSAHVSDDFKETCLQSGASGYMPKPCTLSGLKTTLEEILTSHRDSNNDDDEAASSQNRHSQRRIVRFEESV